MSCGLVPLTEGGATVGTPSLAQCKAEEEAQGEEEDGTQDPEACEVILQDANSETHTIKRHSQLCFLNILKLLTVFLSFNRKLQLDH